MTDLFSAAVAMQREILRAQKAQMEAAQTMLDAGRRIVAAQEATQKAANSNLAAWNAWAKLWGWK